MYFPYPGVQKQSNLLYACSMDVDFCFLTVLSRLLMYIFMRSNFDQEENDSHFFGKELYVPSMGADRSILVSALLSFQLLSVLRKQLVIG